MVNSIQKKGILHGAVRSRGGERAYRYFSELWEQMKSGRLGDAQPCRRGGRAARATGTSEGVWKVVGCSRRRREERRECDKAGGGFGEGRGRSKQGKGGGVGRPGVLLSTLSQFPHTSLGPSAENPGPAMLRGVPAPRRHEADALRSVPLAIPTVGTGDSVLPAATHPSHHQPQTQQASMGSVLTFVGGLAQAKMEIRKLLGMVLRRRYRSAGSYLRGCFCFNGKLLFF